MTKGMTPKRFGVIGCDVTREYTSASRDRAKSDTRAAIMEAVVNVILKEGVHAFTVQNVADKAGVSHRTVYRHFPSREQLVEGLSDAVHESAVATGMVVPTNVAEMRTSVGPLFEQFSRMQDALRASVIAAVALGYQTAMQRRSSAAMVDMLVAAHPRLPREDLVEAAAVLRTIVSRYGWYVMRVDLELQPAQTSRAVTWAVGALLDDLKQRNDAVVSKNVSKK
jgi:AcrR family transcriptional regulator